MSLLPRSSRLLIKPLGQLRFLLGMAVVCCGFVCSNTAFADSPTNDSSLESVASTNVPESTVATYDGDKAGDQRQDNELEMTLVWCPPGTFTMGSNEGETIYRKNEGKTKATLTHGFWIGQFEVTQAEWKVVMGYNTSEFSPEGRGKYKVLGKETSNYPAESMLVEEADEFCSKLTELERSAGRLPDGCVYALPTEVQWEYACRAGTTTATAFGDKLSSHKANFKGFAPYKDAKRGPFLFGPTSVGSYPGNDWGIHDMHGNLWEYCAGWYSDAAPGGINPKPATSGDYRIGKGGSWFHDGRYTRSSFRYWIEPKMRQGTVGFRVVFTKAD